MRVLFTCHPGHGHLFPLIPLARAYQEAGHEVLLATGANMCPVGERLGFATMTVGLSASEIMGCYRARLPEMAALPPEAEFNIGMENIFVRIGATTRAADLVPLARDWEPDLIVHDVVEFAAPVAAALTGASRAIHGSGVPPLRQIVDPMMPAIVDLLAEWGLDRTVAAALWDAPYLDIWPRVLRQPGPIAASDVRPLRPQSIAPQEGEQLPAWVGELPHERTIYVTLGTAFNDAPGLFEAVLAGLRDEPINLIVTLGPASNPARLGPQRAGVIVERFLPQALVLPRCDAVICHAGAGTTLGALAHGLPLVLLPQGAEQFFNAAACGSAGAGIVLPPDAITPEAVRTATMRVLDGTQHRERARQMAAEIAAMPAAEAMRDQLLREIRPLAVRR